MTRCHNFPTWNHGQFFWRRFVSLFKFSYWSKFLVNIVTGSGVITIYKRLIRNPEIRKSPIWVLPNIWRMGQVRNTNFGMDVSIEMLPNAAKFQDYCFYHFWVIKGKLTGCTVCITARENILASGNLCFRAFKLQVKVIHENVCYFYNVWVN